MTDREICEAVARKLCPDLKPHEWPGGLKDYCHSIEAAFEIVEKMIAEGYSVTVNRYPKNRLWLTPPYEGAPGPKWEFKPNPNETSQCIVSWHDVDSESWIVGCDPIADTAPMAICLAFLKLP